MSVTFTITLTDAQHKALAHVAKSPKEWIENAVFTRCDAAMDEIVSAEVEKKLAAGEAITGNKDSIVLNASIKSAAELDAEARTLQPAI
jgi:hypothetical protein